ncbi:predicted protein [Arabidopsis lyrata subsp. lyrata]|uniref:Predicted protein n=1 Tax=Arabidopsis lyrata subsp. lyrata TaxID=81972 RepID=D7LJ46_ARALL|nr:predicted protein [Arabidopsis lyrata subsp. lyrata]
MRKGVGESSSKSKSVLTSIGGYAVLEYLAAVHGGVLYLTITMSYSNQEV